MIDEAMEPGGAVPPFTDPERDALLAAVGRHCTCAGADGGGRRRSCTGHSLLDDASILRRLIFYRRWHLALRRGEWLKRPSWTAVRQGGDSQPAP